MNFDPAKYHRRSIRLNGHDYAGGGLYFVTLCAHREFIAAANGNPFGATQVSPVREIIKERMRITTEKCPEMRWDEAVIMPDHFHALISMKGGYAPLGDIIGGFKAAISREVHCRGDILVDPDIHVVPDMRIWHRNYYERIVRTPEAAENIRRYIRMNPWKCIQDFGSGLRGMGNPALWNAEKTGVLCSRNAPPVARIPEAEVYLGGFHSPPEQKILEELLKRRAKIIYCPVWGLGNVPAAFLSSLEENRMLILEMTNRDGNLAAAEQRNCFVIQNADNLWIPHISKGGMLDRLLKETNASGKLIS